MRSPRPAGKAGRGGGGFAARLDHRPSTAPLIDVPPDVVVRLHIRGPAFLVVAARPPLPATPEALLATAPSLHALLSHDPGCAWPDRPGAQLVEEVLRFGRGGAMLEFATLADALACKARLEGCRA